MGLNSENFHISISNLEKFLMALGYYVWQEIETFAHH